MLSFFFTSESFTLVKLVGIFLSIGGACIVALKDNGEGTENLGALLKWLCRICNDTIYPLCMRMVS